MMFSPLTLEESSRARVTDRTLSGVSRRASRILLVVRGCERASGASNRVGRRSRSFILQFGNEFGGALAATGAVGKVVPGIGDDGETRTNINVATAGGELAERH